MIDETSFLPVVGFPIGQKRMLDDYEEGRITFDEAVAISALNAAIFTATMIVGANANYLTAMQFQRLGKVIMSPVLYGTIGLAAGVHVATKPGATVKHDRYGVVRVMPKFGIY